MSREIPKLLDSRDPEEVKMCWDKLRLRVNALAAVWSVGAFFNGAITVGQPVPRFVIPEAPVNFFLTHLKITFQAGTPSGDTEVEVYLLSGGTETLLGTSILEDTDEPDSVASILLPTPVELIAGDVIKWDCIVSGGHEEVTAVVTGRQGT